MYIYIYACIYIYIYTYVYMVVKSPGYVCVKSLCVCLKCPQIRSITPQRSPLYLQKSHIYPHKNVTFL